jgi:hypothetical protein
MGYATVEDVQGRMSTTMSESEQAVCENLLEDAAAIIDTFAPDADADAKKYVSVRMVIRSLDTSSDGGFPIGTTQGSQSALGYSASFTLSNGSGYGELYLSKLEKQMLGIISNKIGSRSPVEHVHGCAEPRWWWDTLWH